MDLFWHIFHIESYASDVLYIPIFLFLFFHYFPKFLQSRKVSLFVCYFAANFCKVYYLSFLLVCKFIYSITPKLLHGIFEEHEICYKEEVIQI